MKMCPVIATVQMMSAIKEAHVNQPNQGARQMKPQKQPVRWMGRMGAGTGLADEE